MSFRLSDRVFIFESSGEDFVPPTDIEQAVRHYFQQYQDKIKTSTSEFISCVEFMKEFLVKHPEVPFKLFGDVPSQPQTLDFIVELNDILVGVEITEIVSGERRASNDAHRGSSGVITGINLNNAYEYVGCEYDEEEDKIVAKTNMIDGTRTPTILNSTDQGLTDCILEESACAQFARVQRQKSKKLRNLEFDGNKPLYSFLVYCISHPILSQEKNERGNPLLLSMKSLVSEINRRDLENGGGFTGISFLRNFPDEQPRTFLE